MEKSLYAITDEVKRLEILLEDECNDQNAEKLASIMSLLQSKTDQCVYFNMEMEDYIELISKRIDELSQVKKTIQTKKQKYEEYVLDCLEKLGVEKIKGELTSISSRKPVKRVVIFDIDQLPAEYVNTKVDVVADKIAIKKDLQVGKEIEGASLVDGKKSIIFKYGGKI
jgi:hypothetical protein